MFKSFRFRFLALVSVLIAIVIFVLTLISVREIKNTALDIFKERGIVAMKQIQETLDAQKFELLAKSLDANNPLYFEECQKLLAIKKIVGCDYLYTMAQKTERFLLILQTAVLRWTMKRIFRQSALTKI